MSQLTVSQARRLELTRSQCKQPPSRSRQGVQQGSHKSTGAKSATASAHITHAPADVVVRGQTKSGGGVSCRAVSKPEGLVELAAQEVGTDTLPRSLPAGDAVTRLRALARSGAQRQLYRLLAVQRGTGGAMELSDVTLASLTDLEAQLLRASPNARTRSMLAALRQARRGVMLTVADQVDAASGDRADVPQALIDDLAEVASAQRAAGSKFAQVRSAMHARMGSFSTGMDVNAFVQAVLRESYLLQSASLLDMARKVEFYNELKKKLRAKLAWARKVQVGAEHGDVLDEHLWMWDAEENAWTLHDDGYDESLLEDQVSALLGNSEEDFVAPERTDLTLFEVDTQGPDEDTLGSVAPDEPLALPSLEYPSVISMPGYYAKEGHDAYVTELETQLKTLGSDSQLANVDMQNALQQQQQTLQLISNISKMLHDTAMSIIRKIGS